MTMMLELGIICFLEFSLFSSVPLAGKNFTWCFYLKFCSLLKFTATCSSAGKTYFWSKETISYFFYLYNGVFHYNPFPTFPSWCIMVQKTHLKSLNKYKPFAMHDILYYTFPACTLSIIYNCCFLTN